MPLLPKFCKTKWFRQGLLVSGGIVVLLIAVLLLAGYLYAQRGKAELAAIQTEIRDAGGKLDFSDYQLKPEKIESPGFLNLIVEAETLKKAHSTARQEAGYYYGYRKGRIIGYEQPITDSSVSSWNFKENLNWSEVQQAYAPVRAAWKTCAEILTHQDVHYQTDYSAGVRISFDHINLRLDFAKTGAMLSFLAVQRGDLPQAVLILSQAKAMDDVFNQGQSLTLIEALVAETVDGILFKVARQSLAHEHLTHKELLLLKEIWPSTMSLQRLKNALEGERALLQNPVWQQASSDTETFLDVVFNTHHPQDEDTWSWPVEVFWRSIYVPFLKDQDHAYSARTLWLAQTAIQKMIEAQQSLIHSTVPYYEYIDYLESPQGLRPWLLPVSRLCTAGMKGSVDRFAYGESLQRQFQIAILLEQYWLQNGTYPDTTDLLTQNSTQDLRDPMTLQPMRYRLESDGSYTLYSVGLNGIDDGGQPVPHGQKLPDGSRVKDRTAPDWLWPKLIAP